MFQIRFARGAKVGLLLTTALILSSVAVRAAPAPGDEQSLKAMTLEELGNITVISVSKEPESLQRTAAAMYVITQDDIRRSGATTIPEVLRLAPGVDVARIDETHWSVGVRGFGDQFSKSVLVLIDGRSIYTPLFAGVWWAVQDTPLEDIDRIEIIRGPGGTVWGANAVNGVINIVTKSAADTTGALVTASTGNVDRGLGTFRYGARRGALAYRLYGKAFRREAQAHDEGDPAFDTWRMGQVGGRADWELGDSTFTVQGDAYGGRVGQSVSVGRYDPPGAILSHDPLDVSGGNVLASWTHQRTDGGRTQVQAYFDRTSLLGPQLGETRNTFDVDVVQQLSAGPRQHVTWGAGARVSPSTFTETVETLRLSPANHRSTILSAFAQDEVDLVAGRLSATIGAKLERYTYTGVEVQPSFRLLWTPTERHAFWGAVTRAVRTPSRLERDVDLTFFAGLANGLPTYVRVLGNPDFASERLLGTQVGYRGLLGSRVRVDVSAFHNRHDDLETFGAASVIVEPTPAPLHAVLAVPYANGAAGTSAGVEIAPTWKPRDWWQLRGAYSFLRIDLHTARGNTDEDAIATYEGSSPRHHVQAQSMIDLPGALEWDVTLRHVSALPARGVDAYTSADVRLGWNRGNGFRLSLTGRNLLDDAHAEFGHDPAPIVRIRRSVVLTATWLQ